jgi:quercetin dioxygenase-like cupin family protein
MSNMLPLHASAFAEILSRVGPHDAYPWHPLPWPGTFSKVLMFEPATGHTFELGKIAAGAVFPAHAHPSLQAQYLVSGRLRLSNGEIMEPGTFSIIPPGRPHGPFEALEDAISFKYFSSLPEYLMLDGSRFRYRAEDAHPGPILEAVPAPLRARPSGSREHERGD